MLAAVQHYVGLKFKDSPEYTRQPQVVYSETVDGGKDKETELMPLTTASDTTSSSTADPSTATTTTTTATTTTTTTRSKKSRRQQPKSRTELEADNKVLRETLDKLHKQLLQAAPPPGPDGKEVPITEDMSHDFYQKLRQSLEPAVLKRTQSLARQDSNESVEVKSTDLEPQVDEEEEASSGGGARAGAAPTGIGGVPLVDKRTDQVVLGARTREWSTDPADDGDDEDNEREEVCVVDLKDMEWWTVVPSEKDREMRALEHKVSEEDCPLDDPYVVLQDGDLVDALADFVAVAIARHPNVKQLTSSEMKGLIDQTFEQLQEQGTLMRMYSWAHFLYSTYGWGTCAYNLYKDPFYARLVLTGVWQAVTWALILVI